MFAKSYSNTVLRLSYAASTELRIVVVVCRKATGSLKLFHDKYNQKTHFAQHQAYVEGFAEAVQYNDQMKPHVNKVCSSPVHPLRVTLQMISLQMV